MLEVKQNMNQKQIDEHCLKAAVFIKQAEEQKDPKISKMFEDLACVVLGNTLVSKSVSSEIIL